MQRTKKELRFFCSRQPLLATYGVDGKGKLFVHVKIWKQQRLYGEIVVTDGIVRIHCRDCYRWHRVVIRQPGLAVLEEQHTPPNEVTDSPTLAPTQPPT